MTLKKIVTLTALALCMGVATSTLPVHAAADQPAVTINNKTASIYGKVVQPPSYTTAAKNNGHFSVTSWGGTWTITFTPTTAFYTMKTGAKTTSRASASSLTTNAPVLIHGTVATPGSQVINANSVTINPINTATMVSTNHVSTLSGSITQVTSVGSNIHFTIANGSKAPVTVIVSRNMGIKIPTKTKPPIAASLQNGMVIHATGRITANNTMINPTITVIAL